MLQQLSLGAELLGHAVVEGAGPTLDTEVKGQQACIYRSKGQDTLEGWLTSEPSSSFLQSSFFFLDRETSGWMQARSRLPRMHILQGGEEGGDCAHSLNVNMNSL